LYSFEMEPEMESPEMEAPGEMEPGFDSRRSTVVPETVPGMETDPKEMEAPGEILEPEINQLEPKTKPGLEVVESEMKPVPPEMMRRQMGRRMGLSTRRRMGIRMVGLMSRIGLRRIGLST
jgi:hypothetical protein